MPASKKARNAARTAGLDMVRPSGFAHSVASRRAVSRFFLQRHALLIQCYARPAAGPSHSHNIVVPRYRSLLPMRRSVLTLCLPLIMAVLAQSPGEGAAPPAREPQPPPMPKTLAE